MKDKMKHFIKQFGKYIVTGLAWSIVVIIWALFISFWLLFLVSPLFILAYIFLPLGIILYVKLKSKQFLRYAQANIILFGGRGSGKSLTQQYLIYHEKNKPLGNIDFGYNEIVSPFDYYEHIRPNDSRAMINNQLTIVSKKNEYEKRNYYFDDTNSYAPNTEDAYLKRHYTSMSLFILIQRHLYDSYTVMNAQSLERMYKNLRELQLDGYVKAMGVRGWGWFWRKMPIIRNYAQIKVRYYSQYDSALKGKLPFEKLGIINKVTMKLLSTTPDALKKIYEAENGVIKDFAIWLRKDKIKYDTREYHKHIFGYPAPKENES